MNIKSSFISALTVSFLLITQNAHADFRNALDAYQKRDGATMLKEVKDAVDKKNDDGIILFLGILKQYPKTWRPTLNDVQQADLFSCLEKAAAQSSLQARYRLAVIPRTESTPRPKPADSPETFATWQGVRKIEEPKEIEEEIARLEPIANKGYAPAAYHLYISNARQYDVLRYQELSSKLHDSPDLNAAILASKDNALKWLTKAAELGNTGAEFVLGMKYLNAAEGFYCGSPLCPPKNEALGWYWMQRAAKQVSEHDLLLGSFAYEMGNLYRQGVAGNKPDAEQAYLWYLLSYDKYSFDDNSSIAAKPLQEMEKAEQLKQFNVSVNTVETIRKAQKTAMLPKLYQGSRNVNKAKSPVFSYTAIHLTESPIKVLDIYANGEVRLLISDAQTFADAQNNAETWKKVSTKKVNEFMGRTKTLELYKDFNRNGYTDITRCARGCPINQYIVTIENKGSVLLVNDKNLRAMQIKALLQEFFGLQQFLCDSDVGKGKAQCEKIYNEIVNSTSNDTYTINVTTDVVTEAASAGTDTVNVAVTTASGTYTVAANVENATLINTVAYNLTGNALANFLKGNAANNTLTDTAGGNDILQGFAGIDTFNDTVGNNLFDGGIGNDIITAGTGRDILIGGLGTPH
jgi:TPR repeat protein